MFGFLNVSKPEKITSHDVVSYLRKITKEKQIGHAGTLDPFATGILPIAIGKATRLIEYLPDDKEYLALICFGKNTDTYDRDGQVIFESEKKVQKDEVVETLKEFKGEIEQFPPMYSAIKVNGKKLYEYAREGKSIDIKPRKVYIERIELKKFDFEKQMAQILVKCSKGTYIRSIAYDLGKKLECGAYLSELTRSQAGNFRIEDAISLYDIKTVEDVERFLEPVKLNMPQMELSDYENNKISVGQFIKNEKNFSNGDTIVLKYNGEIKAIAKVYENIIKAEKVFNL